MVCNLLKSNGCPSMINVECIVLDTTINIHTVERACEANARKQRWGNNIWFMPCTVFVLDILKWKPGSIGTKALKFLDMKEEWYCQDGILPKSLSNSSYVMPMVGENIFREALHSDYNGKIRLSRSNFSEKLNTRLQGRIFCSMPSVATYAAAGVGLVAVGLYLVR